MKAARRFSEMNCKKKIDFLILVWECGGRGGKEASRVCVWNTNIFFRPLVGCILKHFSLSLSLSLGDILANGVHFFSPSKLGGFSGMVLEVCKAGEY